jgi:hypothetical protein
MQPDTATAAPTRTPSWWGYLWWGLAGALFGMGVLALLSIGIVLLAAAMLLTAVGIMLPALRNRSAVAVPSGVACALLYLAWINRDGPGDVCETTGLETKCTEQWSPWPFLVAALLLVAVSVALARHLRRTTAGGEAPQPPTSLRPS